MMEHATRASSTPARILVVDDFPTNLHLLEGILLKQGYDVRLAPDGAFALQFVQTQQPDLILLDVNMPEIDGYEVCRRIKTDPDTQAIPVVFISALGETQDKLKGFAAGGVDYIAKPFHAEEVLARVNTHLTLYTLRRNLEQEVTRRTKAEEELHTLNDQLKIANQRLEDTNQQLQLTNQELHNANASKDTFFSIIAHDLRSPFQGLLNLTELLSEQIELHSKDELKKKIDILHDASETVYALLTNLLTWSRLERGLLDYTPGPIVLEMLFERNKRLLLPNAKQKNITLTTHVPKDVCATGDFNMIDTVVRNLLSNAVKFTTSGGSIAISAHAAGDMVEIIVTDTGTGIPRELLEKLFRIDVKSSKPGTAGEPGSGLGLILCKELVRKNGGSIRVESEIGKGSTFTFSLPLHPQEE